MKILTSVLAIAFCLINSVENFIPAKILDEVINKLDSTLSFDFGKVNPTLTHEEILRRGIIKSIANYFYAKENGSILIDKSKVANEYLNINRIYIDYYGKGFCNLPINRLLKYELLPNVAIVDLDSKTKDLPYAHFDAETFIQAQKFRKIVLEYSNSKKVSLKFSFSKIINLKFNFFKYSKFEIYFDKKFHFYKV